MTAEGQAVDDGVWSPARAKLNLYLHITGRRADGFHLLESLVGFAAIGDVVSANAAAQLTLAVKGPFAAALEGTAADDNLVLRAAHALKALARTRGIDVSGAAVTLDKHLPVASGIGGGSADSAAALHVLARLWRIDVSLDDLKAIGQTLGSDIPACVAGRPALMRGAGEILEAVPALPAAPLVLVNPGIAVPTPPVYKAFAASGALTHAARPAPTGPWTSPAALVTALENTTNDLEPAAISLCPAIADCLAALRGQGALLARMSGSGATCFGVFASEAAAGQAAARIFADHPRWWSAATSLIAD